ncbi:MAG: hypothetical protein BWY74_00327 [Firmicutes bacterium ADurb.Bin419]|nr:MAG: hypothetical protein BWY74_00327 [Firmicutes bacterium ADurb.Bin419]
MKVIATFDVNGETVARLMIDDNEVYHVESDIFGHTTRIIGKKRFNEAIHSFTSVIKFEYIMKHNKQYKIQGD